jgi:poly(beta-D-mannuronate) lyase
LPAVAPIVAVVLLARAAGSDSTASAAPPATVLDLASWKLTLPVDTDRAGRPDEVKQPELATFEDSSCFFLNDGGDGVVFRAPCGGATTKGSAYPRCELREMSRGDERAAWGTNDGGSHTLTATLAVTKVPPVKPHVVCAQIHGGDDDLLMVRLEGKKLLIQRESHDDLLLDSDYALGARFELKIVAGDGRVRVWHNGALKLAWSVSHGGCYFKAGCYTQSNPKRGDAPDAFGEVVIYRLAVAH